MNVIQIDRLTKKYGDFTAVDNISFTVNKGELIGFLGVNGAGKSTTINMMSTLLEPTNGKINICGFDIKNESSNVRRKIGIVYQGNVLDDLLTVKENLLCRGILHGADKLSAEKKLKELSEIFSLNEILKKKYRNLSGGQKRRCEIAAALMHTPEVLILDEPTTGLDPSARKYVWNTIEQLRKNTDMTVFLTTHYMEEAAEADRIIIINKGKIIAQGIPYELKEKFASDHLKIYCNEDKKDTIISKLKISAYENTNYGIKIPVQTSKKALDILNCVSEDLESFEMIQGSLDDVFINATKEEY
ncbi:MAG: ATP-binding cassette domain-containing protein [Ruminococcus flavefaciens]|nr:ATP-binding cassette domain-containing protein [Ruminococcus flavefaciens]MCM1062050.1 ATP-binding cassette domain-containing protein [Eubacterium sp.]